MDASQNLTLWVLLHMPRTLAEIDAENNRRRREDGVAAFVEATNASDGGAYGYQAMLERLFGVFESDHGTGATIDTVLEALKPILRHHHDLGKLRLNFDRIMDEVESSN